MNCQLVSPLATESHNMLLVRIGCGVVVVIHEPRVVHIVMALQPSPSLVDFPAYLARRKAVRHSVQLSVSPSMIAIVGVPLPISRVAATIAGASEVMTATTTVMATMVRAML